VFVSKKLTISDHASKNEGKKVVNIVLCDDIF